MPYKNAPYYIIACIAVIVAGFWESYFSVWGEVSWQFHAHGVAASIWVLMVLVQSVTIHKAQLPLHRAIGKSSLILFPFLIAGLFAIIDLTAKGFAAGDGPVRTLFGGQFLIGLALAVAAYVVLYFRALKHRRKVWQHAGYMLATPLILFESPASRVIGTWVPGLTVRGPEDFGLVMVTILLGMAIELAIIGVIWWRLRDKAMPFLVAGLFIVAQMLTMGLLVDNAPLENMLMALSTVSSATIVAAGFLLGAATSWAGWQAGKRTTAPPPAALQAA